MIFCIGCDSTKTQNTNSNEMVTSSKITTQAATQITIQATTQVNIPSTIYISEISNSARSIHYSLTKDFEISKDALAFDNDCKYYNNLNQQISFKEFATIIQASNKLSNTVKCNIITKSNNNKLIVEAYIAE